VGIAAGDTPRDVAWLASRLLALRLFDSPTGSRWALGASAAARPLLIVSQFTLHAQTSKGAKPSFHRAAGGAVARPLYEALLRALRAQHSSGPAAVREGAFGEMMAVSSVNDGPVTLIIDSWAVGECGGPGREEAEDVPVLVAAAAAAAAAAAEEDLDLPPAAAAAAAAGPGSVDGGAQAPVVSRADAE